ncbi:hypothetical protein ZHAS_00016154 [Anopheles sinensis]|uniref:Uncharacterized protein n=1 Tax=Anopheles sinensis TaxID=74873 RepID=A0A084WCU1_ANOSI|nr:hypothetical protein ZHAS_00016154 [Anopheles sinensis]
MFNYFDLNALLHMHATRLLSGRDRNPRVPPNCSYSANPSPIDPIADRGPIMFPNFAACTLQNGAPNGGLPEKKGPAGCATG